MRQRCSNFKLSLVASSNLVMVKMFNSILIKFRNNYEMTSSIYSWKLDRQTLCQDSRFSFRNCQKVCLFEFWTRHVPQTFRIDGQSVLVFGHNPVFGVGPKRSFILMGDRITSDPTSEAIGGRWRSFNMWKFGLNETPWRRPQGQKCY